MSTIPWTEKFRPTVLNDIISHEHIINTLKVFVKNKCLPHMLFHGPPGTGKTSSIMACSKELYGEYSSVMVMELNASDDRGIEIVRNKIKKFVMSENVLYDQHNPDQDNKKHIFKLVILDETDAMTDDAQAILRQVVEKYTKNARFCLICNYIKKINPALQSRCTSFHFKPLCKAGMTTRLNEIVKLENINITNDGFNTIIKRSNGDMRKALNILQPTSMANEFIDEQIINKYTGYPQKEIITIIINNIVSNSYKTTFDCITQLQKEDGLSLSDIITEIHSIIFEYIIDDNKHLNILHNIDKSKLSFLLSQLKIIEFNQSINTTDTIQLASLIGIFKLSLY
jgi:replication factor C subunit 3/5